MIFERMKHRRILISSDSHVDFKIYDQRIRFWHRERLTIKLAWDVFQQFEKGRPNFTTCTSRVCVSSSAFRAACASSSISCGFQPTP